jgi:hypothetical protein
MNKDARRSLMKWLPILERIILAWFKTKIRNLTVIQCYATTEMTENEKKEEFYQQLSETIATATKRDVIIVMGDMNAKFGSNNEGLEHVMGRHGIGNMNENGELFSELCDSSDLIIGGTVFPHKILAVPGHALLWLSAIPFRSVPSRAFPSHPILPPFPVASHPIASRPVAWHPIPSRPIPYIKTRAYLNATLCQNLKPIGEEVSEIV